MMKNFKPIFTITNRITTGLTRIERARGFLEAATLSESWIREMGNRALMLEAHHTAHIEGARLTLEQAEGLWQGDSVPEADPDEARELLNYRKAFDFVSEYLKSGDAITEGLIRGIHKWLVEGISRIWKEKEREERSNRTRRQLTRNSCQFARRVSGRFSRIWIFIFWILNLRPSAQSADKRSPA